jgi:hypothetical protein
VNSRALGVLLAVLIHATQESASIADTFQRGDLLVGTTSIFGMGSVSWYRNGTRLATNSGGGGVLGLAFDQRLRLYATDGEPVDIFDPNFNLIGALPVPLPLSTELVVDAAGNAYVGLFATRNQIAKIDATSGAVIRQYDLGSISPVGIASIDLASDQCTLLVVTSSSDIRRLDVCSGVLASDGWTVPDTELTTIRILPEGTVLVTARTAVYRLNASGAVIQTYTQPGASIWDGLAIDPGGSTFWASSSSGNLTQFSLRSGAVLQDLNERASALAVVGEPRAATSPAQIPALDVRGLVLLAIALCAIAGIAHRQ